MHLLKDFEIPKSPNKFFMLSVFGLIISTLLFIGGIIDLTWSVTFSLTFLIMLISSLIAIAPPKE